MGEDHANAQPAPTGARKRRWKRRGGRKHPNRPERRHKYAQAATASGQPPASPVATQAATPTPVSKPPDFTPRGNGAEPIIDTALFERPQETRSDAKLVKRAIRQRWNTPKQLSEVVLQKALTLAAGLPWRGPDGQQRTQEFSPAQLLGAGKLALDIERQNQHEEHHGDRMEYADKALAQRGQYNPAVRAAAKLTLGAESDSGQSVEFGVAVYLPSNGRDDEELVPEPRLPGE
jgi:hypothetical protein